MIHVLRFFFWIDKKFNLFAFSVDRLASNDVQRHLTKKFTNYKKKTFESLKPKKTKSNQIKQQIKNNSNGEKKKKMCSMDKKYFILQAICSNIS